MEPITIPAIPPPEIVLGQVSPLDCRGSSMEFIGAWRSESIPRLAFMSSRICHPWFFVRPARVLLG
jgi:hypothetical protein